MQKNKRIPPTALVILGDGKTAINVRREDLQDTLPLCFYELPESRTIGENIPDNDLKDSKPFLMIRFKNIKAIEVLEGALQTINIFY
jgi:hypothetical protein